MRPKAPEPSSSSDLFRNRLENLLDQRHQLHRLTDLIDWSRFEDLPAFELGNRINAYQVFLALEKEMLEQ